MRGYMIVRLSIFLAFLVCVMIATRTIMESFDGTAVCDTKSVAVRIRGESFCFPPGITNIPVSEGANTVEFILYPNMSATLYSGPDGTGSIVKILPDKKSATDTITVSYTNLAFGSIFVTYSDSTIRSGSGPGSGPASGPASGSGPAYGPVSGSGPAFGFGWGTHTEFYEPDLSCLSDTQDGVNAAIGESLVYNQTITRSQDCSTFNDCSC